MNPEFKCSNCGVVCPNGARSCNCPTTTMYRNREGKTEVSTKSETMTIPDAELLEQIEKRHELDHAKYIDCSGLSAIKIFDLLQPILHELHKDRATLLRIAKARQPHVTLTHELFEEMAAHLRGNWVGRNEAPSPSTYFCNYCEAQEVTSPNAEIRHTADCILKHIDRICLTKAESE